MVNHISRQSDEFRDFERHGRAAASGDLFITLDKVWPGSAPTPEDVARIFLRKRGDPFSTVVVEETGQPVQVWTTFGTADGFEQVDLDLRAPATRRLVAGWFECLAAAGVRMVRLDAVGYVVKRAGTSCFMVEPEIWDVLDWLRATAERLGMLVLPEVHAPYAIHERLAARGYWTYDFVLPGLVLHALTTGESARLAAHLRRAPERQVTTLDCHDGIPVSPDLDGILDPAEMTRLAALVVERGGNVNRILSDAHAGEVDVHQLNCTYYSALGEDDDRSSRHAPSSCSRGASRRSTTWACWRARTTMPRWSGQVRDEPSTATTTRSRRWTGPSIGPSSGGSWSCSGYGPPTRRSPGL